MIPYERQQRILELLETNSILKIEDLRKEMPDVSESTLRRDIHELEGTHQVEKLAGGAIMAYSPVSEVPFEKKADVHPEEKRHIAEIAASFIHPEDTIYIDSGSTCAALLRIVLDMNIQIITTNTEALRLVTPKTKAEVTLTGGRINSSISSLYGTLTTRAIELFQFDEAFLGANGLDVEHGITTPHLEESQKKALVSKHAKKLFVLADSSKFRKVSTVHALDLDKAVVISDAHDDRLEKVTQIIC